MKTVYFDSNVGDDLRRKRLYDGELYLYSPKPAMLKLVKHARAMIEGAFGSIKPEEAQFHMPVEKYVEIVAPLKPKFIHDPQTMKILREVVIEFGCDPETTFVDVPRLRMVTSDGYLTSGVGYAHHPHRDTWYSAPMTQINWWLPIYDIETEQSMAFHPHYWDKPIKNGSKTFNYYDWNNTSRKDAAKHIKSDTRVQPKAEEDLQLKPEVRFVMPSGGVVQFSAAHLHSTVPNDSGRARYSIDFRTVNLTEVKTKGGAKNIDSHCSGTSLRDFKRASDGAQMDESVVAQYDDASSADGVKVFKPEMAAK